MKRGREEVGMCICGLKIKACVPSLFPINFNVQEGCRAPEGSHFELNFPTILGAPIVECNNECIEGVFSVILKTVNIVEEPGEVNKGGGRERH